MPQGVRHSVKSRWRLAKILQFLQQHGPLALCELAQMLDVHDYQISLWNTDSKRDGASERSGARRRNPATGWQPNSTASVILKSPRRSAQARCSVRARRRLKFCDVS